MLSTIDTLAVADGAAAGADEVRSRLQEMSRRTDAMHYLVASLRQVANDPAQTDTPSSETCNAVAAVQSAVMSLLSREGSAPPALSFRHQLEGGENRVPFRHSTVVAAAGETLQCIVKPGVSLSMLAVRVDTAAGLPAEIGAVSNTPPSGTDGHPARRMLRIRLAAHDDNDNGTDAPSGMKMLADNLEAFQTLREPGPSQAALVEHGGTILWRREHDVTTYLIYLPLASV
jgi:hypothetical protein